MTKLDEHTLGTWLRWLVAELLHTDADIGAVRFVEHIDGNAVTLDVHVADEVAGLLIGKGGTLCAALSHMAACASQANRASDGRAWRVQITADPKLSVSPTPPRTPLPMEVVVRRLVEMILDPRDRDALVVEHTHNGFCSEWAICGEGLLPLLLGRAGANVQAIDTIVQAVSRARSNGKCRVNVTRPRREPDVVRTRLTAPARV